MAETTAAAQDQAGAGEDRDGGHVTLRAEDVHVIYHAFQEHRPTLRQLVARKGRRRSSRPIHAVKGVSFEARTGETIGVIGRNGSGKSTLMRAIAGLLPATSGQVLSTSKPMLLGVGAAFEQGLSGRRNIELGCLALGLSRREIAERMDDIVAFSGLEDYIDLPLKAYSSGMRARLQFSVATEAAPEILIVDEALSVGDAAFQERSQERIDQMRDDAGTIFIVTHSLGTIRKGCTRALWLQDGVLMADGDPNEVVDEYEAFIKRTKQQEKKRKQHRKRKA